MSKDVGFNIKKMRNEKGLTQKELAELSGIHLVSIKKYETHKMKPQIQQLERIAKALNCNLEQLCEYKKVSVEPNHFENCLKGFTTGDKIKKYRIMKGITQKELGFLVDLSDDRIRQYEVNIRKPKEELLLKIANALGTPIECFIDRNINSENDVIAILDEIKESFGINIIKKYLDLNK